MPSNFKSLLKNRDNELDKLEKEDEKSERKGGAKDDRFWKLSVDKSGNGYAVIRFLPTPPGEDETMPYVRYWEFGFKGPGGWYIEMNRKTLGKDEPDPVFEYKGELWNTGTEENQNKVRGMKSNKHFVSNIQVIKDPANPENEGKVFLYRYGQTIYEKIKDMRKPDDPDDEPINVFDPIEGANFRLKAYTKSRENSDKGFRAYDKSYFEQPSPMGDGDEDKMEEIWESEYPLQPLVSEDAFKSYEELQDRLHRVMKIGKYAGGGGRSGPSHGDEPEGDDEDEIPDFGNSNFRDRMRERKETPTEEPKERESTPASSDEEDEENEFEMFQNLADDD